MSTPDQLLYSALHGTAMGYAAARRNLDESIEELRQIADTRKQPPDQARDHRGLSDMPAQPLTSAMS